MTFKDPKNMLKYPETDSVKHYVLQSTLPRAGENMGAREAEASALRRHYRQPKHPHIIIFISKSSL